MIKRLSLRKEPVTTVTKRLPLRTSNYRDDAYHYLRFKRNNEKISRVDRYSIILYWDEVNAEGNPVTLNELLFYPSEFGMNEIEKYNVNGEAINSNQAKWLAWRLDQLKTFGNPWWHHDTKEMLNPSNWILKNPQISSMQEYDQGKYIKPGSVMVVRKKLKLKEKPKRLKLRKS